MDGIELETMSCAEKRLVLSDRLSLIIEDRPAASDPARVCGRRLRVIEIERSRLALNLLLDFATEAVGVAEAELNLEALGRQRSADVSFAGQRRRASRLPLRRVVRIGLLRAPKAVEVIDDSTSGIFQQHGGRGVRIGRVKEGVELSLRRVCDKAGEPVTFHRRGQWLPHDGGADYHT